MNLRHLFLWIGLWATLPQTHAQSVWEGMYLEEGFRQEAIADTATQRVYYFGLQPSPLQAELWVWESGGWGHLASFPGAAARGIYLHQDTVLMGVAAVEGNSGLAYYAPDGSTGDFGHFSDQVYRVRSIDDTLYAAGYFAEVDGQAASGIAKRVDGHWVPVGTMPDPYRLMGDVIRYQGDLISVGQGHSENGGRCIYRLEGDEWHVLAGGITDQLSSASGLVEFQGDLYISGYFSTGTGSAGCGVMRWDGTAYHDVGGGLLRAPFDHDGPTSITSMEVHNGLLYCTGAFQYAGDDTPASGLAIWDGARWCGANGLLADLEDHPQNSVTDLAFLGDTLFVSCGPRIDGEEVGNAARAPMSEVMGACDDTGLLEPTPELPLTLVPNPAEDLVSVLSMPPGARAWVVRDALGRTVFTGQVLGTSFPVVHLVPGAYSLSVLGQGGNTLACGRFVRR